MVDTSSLVQVVGTLGLGSMLGQYLTSGGQRRETRAAVLRALAECERARWFPLKDGEPNFAQASHELIGAGLVARIPQEAVHAYVAVGRVAAGASSENWQDYQDDEHGGWIDGRLGSAVTEAATLVSDLAWSPWRHRVRLKSRIRALHSHGDALEKQKIDWTRNY